MLKRIFPPSLFGIQCEQETFFLRLDASFVYLFPANPSSVVSNAIMLPLILYRTIDIIQLSRPFIQSSCARSLRLDRQSAFARTKSSKHSHKIIFEIGTRAREQKPICKNNSVEQIGWYNWRSAVSLLNRSKIYFELPFQYSFFFLQFVMGYRLSSVDCVKKIDID